MKIIWSLRAARELESFLDYVAVHAFSLVREARDDAFAATERLVNFPYAHRAARWAGLREMVVPRWNKLIVYRVKADRVVIIAFLDTRQDLGAMKLHD